MFIIEKLSLKNLKYFKTLQEEANDKYINNKDFLKYIMNNHLLLSILKEEKSGYLNMETNI